MNNSYLWYTPVFCKHQHVPSRNNKAVWVIFRLIYIYLFSRLVYKWFYLVHKGTTALTVIGYFIIMLTLFGTSIMFRVHPDTAAEVGLLALFYGLYFGVLARDFAEICADKMASKLGVSCHSIVCISCSMVLTAISMHNTRMSF